ncbi:MAG: NADH:flavin oxidoreductase/NADH oxidase family protein [Neisseria sp.]|nr:NADH:flavin oxidoreductase/NADH oxidase family protein [Neisseria sp.]
MLTNTPFTLPNGATAPNRILKAAMNEQLADRNCRPTEALVRLYQRWADGGAGVLITGNVMIDKTALTGAGAVAVENDADLPLLTRWAQAGRSGGALLLMQLNHPGKQSPKDINPAPVAPSAVPLSGNVAAFFNPPRALSEDEILDLIKRFGNTAAVAEHAGFSGVQIHAAHGYLISQFLSPHHNRRDDRWGGSLENRMRFLLEIYREIRRRTAPGFTVSVKLNSADFQKGGFSEEDSLRVAQTLAEEGVDLLELSGGNYEAPAMWDGVKESTRRREAYFLDYAAKVRQACAVPLAVTGGFRSAAGIAEALDSGDTDFVGIGKPFALLPDLPKKLFADSFIRIATPPVRLGIAKLDNTLGSMLEMQWYIRQMHLLAEGRMPQPKLCAWKVLAKMLWEQGTGALRRERA